MEQKPLISYPQIFLKFLLYFMIDVMTKKSFFLINLFSPFFILQAPENSDFSYLSLHDFLRLFRPIIMERGNLFLILKHVCANNFLWDLHNKRF